MAEPLELAAEKLEAAARALAELPALMAAALAFQRTQQSIAAATTPAAAAQQQTARTLPDAARDRAPAIVAELTAAQQQAAQALAEAARDSRPQARAQAQAQSQARVAPAMGGPLQTQQNFPDALARAATTSQAMARMQDALAARPVEEPKQRGALDVFDDAMTATTRSVMAFRSSMMMAERVVVAFGQAASPTHVATYEASKDLLMARLGQAMTPFLEEASRVLQFAARNVPDTQRKRQELLGFSIEDVVRESSMPLPRAIADLAGAPKKPEIDYSKLQPTQLSSFEQFADRMESAGLLSSSLQGQIQQEQLKALNKILEELKARPIQVETAPAGNPFR